MSVIKLRKDVYERLSKYKQKDESWSDVINRLLDRVEGIEVTKKLPERLPCKRHERWLEEYGRKWENLCKLIELHHLRYHRSKEVPDDIRKLIEKLKEGL